MSKNSNFDARDATNSSNGGLTAEHMDNASDNTHPAKSLQEALDRGLTSYEYTTSYGRTYTIEVERALRARRKIQIEQSKRTPRMLLEPDERDQRDRETIARRRPLPPPTPEQQYLHRLNTALIHHYFESKREWEQEKAKLEEDLRTGRYASYPDSYWRFYGLEPPKEEQEEVHEEEEEIDLGYSDTSDDTDITEEEVITIDE